MVPNNSVIKRLLYHTCPISVSKMNGCVANRVVPDQMPFSATSDLGAQGVSAFEFGS